jgi:signal transduction histidine kinase
MLLRVAEMCQIETAVNHEVRTALNAIMGFAQILNSEENTIEEIHTYAGIICQQSENLLEIFNDMINRLNSKEEATGLLENKTETCG